MQRLLLLCVFFCSAQSLRAQLTLATALDAPELEWSTGGDASWSPQSAARHDGVDAAQSGGPLLDLQHSWLQTIVIGPGALSFWWSVSSEAGYDYLEFTVDDVLVGTAISGEVGWQQRSTSLAAGAHTLRWRYYKDGSLDLGQDRAWVDEVVFAPEYGPARIYTQPANRTALAGANASFSVVAGGSPPLICQWFFNATHVLSGGTHQTLILTNVQPANVGSYHVIVSNSMGSATSTVAILTVVPPPTQIVNGSFETGNFSGWMAEALAPPSQALPVFGVSRDGFSPGAGLFTNSASDGQFSATHGFNGDGPGTIRIAQEIRIPAGAPILNFEYRMGWDMLNFLGSTQPRLFNVVLRSAGGGPPLATATLVTAWPGTQNLDSGLQIGSLDLTPFADQTVRVCFEWFIPESFTGPGHFQLDNVYLTAPDVAPQIVTQPDDRLAGQWAPVTFSAGVRGTPPLFQQWYYNATNRIAGAIDRVLALPPVQSAEAGLYHSVVSNAFGSVTSRVARLTVFPLMDEALEATNLVWTAGGTAPWLAQTLVSYDGVDAAQSGAIADFQESWLETTLDGPGTLSFWWRVSSQQDWDWLRFYIDGVLQQQISGEVVWHQRTFSIPEGRHAVRWRYVKDLYTAGGQDKAWLDQVRFTPSVGAPIIVTQPASQTMWEGANVTLSVGALGGPPLSYRWYFNQTNLLADTGPTLFLPNLLNAGVGTYRVVVSNAFNSVTSNPAVVTLGSNGPATNVLLFIESFLPSAFEIALDHLNQPYQRFVDANAFTLAVNAANRTTTLLVIDQSFSAYDFSAVIHFVNGGGRALVQSFSLLNRLALQEAFQVTIDARSNDPIPVHDWGGSPLFSGLPTALDRVGIGLGEDTQKLQPMTNGQAVAGFAEPAPGEAAVVIGRGGRTIVNGFWATGISPQADAVRFAENEILFLTGPVSATAPIVRLSPRSQRVLPGASVSLRVTAWGAAPLTYQWRFNGTNALPAAGDTFMLPSAQLADAGEYSVVVGNAYGAVTSQMAMLTVTPLLPVSRALLLVDSGSSLFSPYPTALANRGLPFQLFSYEAGLDTALATASPVDTLVVVDAPLYAHAFSGVREFVRGGGRAILTYWRLHLDSVLADTFQVSVGNPLILPQPVQDWGRSSLFSGLASPLSVSDRLNYSGQTLQPVAEAQALAGFVAAPTEYQAAAVLGNDGSTLVKGFLLAEVSERTSAVQFAENELEVLAPRPPSLLVQPQGQVVALSNAVTLSVTAQGSFPLRYQWHRDGLVLNGATNAAFAIASAQSNHMGAYTVAITNRHGAVTSQVARLDLGIPLVIVQPPLSQTVVTAGSVTFSVEVTGHPAPFDYEWRRITSPRFTNRVVLNERRSFFTIDNAQTNHAGSYAVVIRNPATPFGVSRTFTLTLLLDADGDGLPDAWELAYPTAGQPNQDTDHDGATNLEEYRAGTDPANPASVLRIDRFTVGGGATLEFLALSNRTYAVEFSDALGSSAWSNLAAVVARATNRTEVIVDPVAASNRIYRLVTPLGQ